MILMLTDGGPGAGSSCSMLNTPTLTNAAAAAFSAGGLQNVCFCECDPIDLGFKSGV